MDVLLEILIRILLLAIPYMPLAHALPDKYLQSSNGR
jgi:hypothetical protein